MATVNLGSIKFKWKGTYAGGTAYTIDDVVSYNGSSYICIQASTGNLPTNATYFEQMSQAGTNGTDGTDLTTTLTTQGDIVVRGASGLERLAIGSAGQALKVNSGATGFEFGTAGGVVQVVQSNLLTKTSTTSTSYTDTGLQTQITPSSSSNKILVMMDASGASGGGSSGHLRITRDGTQLRLPSSVGSRTADMSGGIDNGGAPSDALAGITSIFLDEPNSTSQLTYKVQIRQGGGGNTTYFNRTVDDGDEANSGVTGSSLILMEIAV